MPYMILGSEVPHQEPAKPVDVNSLHGPAGAQTTNEDDERKREECIYETPNLIMIHSLITNLSLNGSLSPVQSITLLLETLPVNYSYQLPKVALH